MASVIGTDLLRAGSSWGWYWAEGVEAGTAMAAPCPRERRCIRGEQVMRGPMVPAGSPARGELGACGAGEVLGAMVVSCNRESKRDRGGCVREEKT